MTEADYREAIADGEDHALQALGLFLADLPDRQADAEAVFRAAVAAGETDARKNLGSLLSDQPGREAEAETIFLEAIAAGDGDIHRFLGWLLRTRRGREADAETAFRRAIADGDDDSRLNLADLVVGQPGREAEVETIYREAITAGDAAAGWVSGRCSPTSRAARTKRRRRIARPSTAGGPRLTCTSGSCLRATAHAASRPLLRSAPRWGPTPASAPRTPPRLGLGSCWPGAATSLAREPRTSWRPGPSRVPPRSSSATPGSRRLRGSQPPWRGGRGSHAW